MAVTSAEDYRSFEEYVNIHEDNKNKRLNYFFKFIIALWNSCHFYMQYL